MPVLNSQYVCGLLEKAASYNVEILLIQNDLVVKSAKRTQIDPEFLTELKDAKSDIIEFLKNQEKEKRAFYTINPATQNEAEHIPLSFGQERLWFTHKLLGSVEYHINGVFEINGELDDKTLEKSIIQIVNRHQTLRTVFAEISSEVFQSVKPENLWRLSYISKSGSNLDDDLRSFINQPFDFSTDHMLRAAILEKDANKLLVIVIHHIAADGWSMPILIKELQAFYRHFAINEEIVLKELPVQYADYAIWQQRHLKNHLDGKIKYWQKKMHEVAALDFFTDYPRTAKHNINGEICSRLVNKELTDVLNTFSIENGATLFMSLLAVFKVLIYRYTQSTDITIGTPTAGRQQQEVENLIGFFINTLALRTKISSEMTFVELLQDVKKTTIEAYENQEVPFEKVVEIVGHERVFNRNPLFDIRFALNTITDSKSFELTNDIKLTESKHKFITTQTDIGVDITKTSDGLNIQLFYRNDLYRRDTMERLLEHYLVLLNAVIENSNEKVSKYNLLTSTEKEQLINQFNFEPSPIVFKKNVVELFDLQILKNPDLTAIVYENKTVTYSDLNFKINEIAQHLSKSGISVGDFVPLFIDRGIDAIASIFAILKIGAAYVPIDTQYTQNRIQYILDDIDAKFIITNKLASPKLHQFKHLTQINLDNIKLKNDVVTPCSKLGQIISSDSIAYIIYTSGSTGKPKGVMIKHEGLANLVDTQIKALELQAGMSVLQFASLSFDASCYEIFNTLLSGGKLVIASPESITDSELLKNLLSDNEVELAVLPPSYQRAVLDEVTYLRTIVSAGEPLNPKLAIAFNQKGVKVINAYGPTENTVCTTFTSEPIKENGVVTIGKPIPGVQVYILDKLNELLPININGEICIGGVQLSKGYLNLPEVTASNFINNPFKKGEFLYKTGDIGRWLSDGNIEYIGRSDDQKKIRGFRIELGEIEQVLLQSKLVSEACVITIDEKESQKQYLLAYVIATDEFKLEDIKEYLKENLPVYMLPQRVIELKEFPLTSNGKIDKKRLKNHIDFTITENNYQSPINDLQKNILNIWKSVLEIDVIGINDNFFEIGGHSLLAMKLISAIRKEIKVEVSFRDLFDYPTIEEISNQIANFAVVSSLPNIKKVERPVNIPASYNQESLYFIHALSGSTQYHVPVVLRLKGDLIPEILESALKCVVDRHEALRTILIPLDKHLYQKVISADRWQLSVVEDFAFSDDDDQLKRYIQAVTEAPFDLESDYNIRSVLIKVDQDEFILIIVVHHIAFDGWSRSILAKEVGEFYNSKIAGTQPLLTPLVVQYADYSLWQREYIQNGWLDKKLEFWKNKLKDIEDLNLPLDYPRSSMESSVGNTVKWFIDADLTNRLENIAIQNKTTLYITLLASFKILLSRYSGQNNISIGVPVAGRHHPGTEDLIGYFINTVVINTDLSGKSDFSSFLKLVNDTTLEAFNYQDVPFEKVVESVLKERNPAISPLFQVTFVLQNPEDEFVLDDFKIGNNEIFLEGSANTKAKFDLVVSVEKTNGGLKINLDYKTDLFAAKTISKILLHYTELLKSVVINPLTPINKLNILPATEKEQITQLFNNTQKATQENQNVVTLIQDQEKLVPDMPLVISDTGMITYNELYQRSNKIANYLVSAGIKESDVVALCMENCADMLISIIGILKAGATYLPIGHDSPADRIDFMLHDSSAKFLITTSNFSGSFAKINGLRILEVDTDQILELMPVSALAISIVSTNIAYIIYTSGSTGFPRGVMVSHANLFNYLTSSQTCYLDQASNKKGTYIHLSNTFDASITALFLPLIHGRSIVITKKTGYEAFTDPLFLTNAPYDFIKLTPGHLEQLSSVQTKVDTSVTDRLVVGGEALLVNHIESFVRSGISVINEYGPTEATVGCSVYEINSVEDILYKNGIVSIGKPINNTYLYVLDNEGEICPVGVSGELYIGGDSVSLGYVNQPELTKERFINNYSKDLKGTVLYRTGDICRWDDNGNLFYEGRNDDQVKIRGHRVSLGEIESRITALNSVKLCTVIINKNEAGLQQLICYVVSELAIDEEFLKKELQVFLPDFMIPNQVILIDTIPLTSNGKVNRKLLQKLAQQVAETNYIRPATLLEIEIANVWQECLGIEKIGINDNYFQLGGDSIKSIQIVNKARKLGHDLQIIDIFEKQTIKDVCCLIQSRKVVDRFYQKQAEVTGSCQLLPIQKWFFNKKNPSYSHFNQSVVLGINKLIDETELLEVLDVLLSHHDSLRFRYEFKNERWHQNYSVYKANIDIEDFADYNNDQFSLSLPAITTKYQTQLDITTGNLIKVVLIKTPPDQIYNRLFITVHHLIIDTVSWGIFVNDLEYLLNSLKNKKSLLLSKKTNSYKDWYEYLKDYSQSETLLGQKQYWENIIGNYYSLPGDFDYNVSKEFKDLDSYTEILQEKDTSALLYEVSKAYNSEVSDILIAALFCTITKWAGKTDLVLGLEGHGRQIFSDKIDVSQTVGWFTNLYPLYIDLCGNNSPDDIIKHVKECIRNVPDKGLGYSVLKYITGEIAEDAPSPWDISFNYFGQLDNSINKSEWLVELNELADQNIAPTTVVEDKLQLNIMIKENKLIILWHYNKTFYNYDTIVNLSNNYVQNINILLNHCLAVKTTAVNFIPADIGLADKISYQEMDGFLNQIINSKKRRNGIEDICRLSGLQNGLLFHSLYEKNTGAYVVQFECELSNIDVNIFEQAWKLLIQKHTILRTGFFSNAFSVPIQCVYQNVKLPIIHFDYSNLSFSARQTAIKDAIQDDRVEDFDFENGPLTRIKLIKISEKKYVFLWTHHHIILDGWSLPILVDKLIKTYNQLNKNGKSQDYPIDNYADYINYINSKDEQREKAYWSNYLKDLEISTLLPFVSSKTNRNRGVSSYNDECIYFNGNTTEAIKKYAANHHITINTIMQGIWAYLLSAYSGADTVAYGVTVSGRPYDLADAENRVGMYINTIPLCTKVNKQGNIATWLQHLQLEQTNCLEHQYVSLNKIKEWVKLEDDLFDSIMTFQNFPYNDLKSQDPDSFSINNINVFEQSTNYPLAIRVGHDNDFFIQFIYKKEILSGAFVKQIAKHFENVLFQIINNTATDIGEVNLLTTAEKDVLINQFNDTNFKLPANETVIGLFSKQAQINSNAIAVIAKNLTISYNDLDVRSNQLAWFLIEKGVNKQDIIPICFKRGNGWAIITILGVLKAGASYVTIDAEYPLERIDYIIKDTSARFVVTDIECRVKIIGNFNCDIIVFDQQWNHITSSPILTPPVKIDNDSLAYIVYTSGSTGNPKGVMVEHRGLVNVSLDHIHELSLTETDNYLQFMSPAFDGAVLDIFSTLLSGAALVLPDKEVLSDRQKFLDYVEKNRISIFTITPSYLSALNKPMLSGVRTIISAGENAIVSDATYYAGFKNFYNGYGPSEATINTTLYKVNSNEKYEVIPIGKPRANKALYIINKDMQLCPIGVVGEIYIGGNGLARAYLNDPELTNEKFITEVVGVGIYGRLYKTGDLGKWLADGNIEYIGRVDSQVKIRGYRIELSEVESLILQSGFFKQAVVLEKKSAQEHSKLVGYVVINNLFDKDAAVKYIKERLPIYMIPSTLLIVEEIPVNNNGKVNKEALLYLTGSPVYHEEGVINARTSFEEKLIDIWSDVLEIPIDQIGIDNNFFDLGGDSIQIVKLLHLLNKITDKDISITTIFNLPTIRSLSDFINTTDDIHEDASHNMISPSVSVMDDTMSIINK